MTPSPRFFLSAFAALLIPAAVFAQSPPSPPPPAWTGSVGAGLALTSGNSDTSNLNVSFKAVHDPKTNLVFRTEGLYIRGKNAGELTADNAALGLKLERKLSDRAYTFLQVQYLRDSFKAIDYFIAPTLGLGYTIVDTERAKLWTDASIGPSWEKNPEQDVRAKLALSFGDKASYALSKTAALTRDSRRPSSPTTRRHPLHLQRGRTASLTGRLQLKLEVVDTYKNKPPTIDIKKNDVSTLISVLYKF